LLQRRWCDFLAARPIASKADSKSSECVRITLGLKTPKAQNEQMFSGLPPKADLPADLRNYSRRQFFANAAIAARVSARSRALSITKDLRARVSRFQEL